MENGIEIFRHEIFGELSVLDRNGIPWFFGKENCRRLDLDNVTEAFRGLDDDEKDQISIPEVSSNGIVQNRKRIIISEGGLYSLIFRSRKPEAKKFPRWVTHVVLPAIRAGHGYGNVFSQLQAIQKLLEDEREARRKFEKAISQRIGLGCATQAMPRIPYQPTVAEIKARILSWIQQAGPDGMPRRIITNRIRFPHARRNAIQELLDDGSAIEVVRNRKGYFVARKNRIMAGTRCSRGRIFTT